MAVSDFPGFAAGAGAGLDVGPGPAAPGGGPAAMGLLGMDGLGAAGEGAGGDVRPLGGDTGPPPEAPPLAAAGPAAGALAAAPAGGGLAAGPAAGQAPQGPSTAARACAKAAAVALPRHWQPLGCWRQPCHLCVCGGWAHIMTGRGVSPEPWWAAKHTPPTACSGPAQSCVARTRGAGVDGGRGGGGGDALLQGLRPCRRHRLGTVAGGGGESVCLCAGDCAGGGGGGSRSAGAAAAGAWVGGAVQAAVQSNGGTTRRRNVQVQV
ncbi:hypothetical protein CHLRE_12g552006v5 [Chlamydomonas reinhardtii]|uniref:Uncharacterized protein n=1 Tax=Chlamydomonas reinhardtii TaxID=3055 RepID=A0A2K3D635_CHLRE|nr:uncharacterized protein CHLRE_12g552006v5 [Chlamydomonas reinhardtii]XP_042918978.1 uncharacterized protein CHLRE_12g552006v5 [Chlamydomonas reinhardtii]PNW75991.1 hypothetical protein CHLRE_12g552006v5 [Chlamydomonas reinhardtii]PNW75992.1 hypothetical protein CHLRE_12g552006v5 [Chlamydomonas reinhardtii]